MTKIVQNLENYEIHSALGHILKLFKKVNVLRGGDLDLINY